MTTPDDTAPRVLLAAHDIQLRSLLRRYLEHSGYVVKTIADGARAAAVAHVYQPAVVVLDLDGPAFDALAVAQRLHADGTARLLLLFGGPAYNNRTVARQLGAADYVAKPLSPAAVVRRVGRMLHRDY